MDKDFTDYQNDAMANEERRPTVYQVIISLDVDEFKNLSAFQIYQKARDMALDNYNEKYGTDFGYWQCKMLTSYKEVENLIEDRKANTLNHSIGFYALLVLIELPEEPATPENYIVVLDHNAFFAISTKASHLVLDLQMAFFHLEYSKALVRYNTTYRTMYTGAESTIFVSPELITLTLHTFK